MRSNFIQVLVMFISVGTCTAGNQYIALNQEISRADSFHREGVQFQIGKDFKTAVDHYAKAQEIREPLIERVGDFKEELRNQILLGSIKSLHNLSVAYYYLDDHVSAEHFSESCIDNQLKFRKNFDLFIPLRLGRAYCQLAKIYQDRKGFDETYTQLQLGRYYLNMVQPLPVRDLRLLENTLSNLFLLWEEADSLILHSQSQLKIGTDTDKQPVTALLNLGIGYELNDNLDKSTNFYNRALEALLPDSANNAALIARIYCNKTYVAVKQSKWEDAFTCIDHSLRINASFEESVGVLKDRSELLMTKAYVFFRKGDYAEAIRFYDAAIILIKSTSVDHIVEQNQEVQGQWIPPVDKTLLLFSLGYKAKAMAMVKQFSQAQSAFTLAINYLNKIRREYKDTESKLKLTEIAKVIFEGAIALHLDPAVNEPEKAFAYAEQSKAFTLLEGIKHSKAMRIAKVPEELLEQEYELRGEIARLERKYLAAEAPEEKTEHLQTIRKHKEELTGLMNRLQRNKEYRKLMSFEAPSSRQLQRKALGVGQTLVEYFVGEEKTYVFVLPKKGRLQVVQLDLDSKELNQQVDEFWSSIYHYGCDEEVLRQEAPALLAMGEEERKERLQERYLTLGQSLYTQLFQPIVDLGMGTRFVIVPDEGLSYLPFDALLVGAPEIDNFSFYPYLGREFTLSYAYSGNLLLEVQQGRGSKAKKILAMAPSFSSRQLAMNKSALSRLTNNVTEINAICDIFSNQCAPLEGMAANLDAFRKLVAQNAYRIIHLSTHGKANDKNPNQSWISFTQNREQLDESQLLYASDLYALPIQADLVVLSACETNKGRLRRGEGIMSFARGFSAAGVKSVLSTFWVIGEDPSLLVMKDFYEQLNEGVAKDEALQKARLGLMENSDFSHPFYWSAFVPIGQMSEVEAGGSGRWLLLVLLGLLLVFGFSKTTSRSS